jgi:hypothetical protein
MRTKPSEYHGNFVIECRSGKFAQARLQRKIKGQDQPALPALAPAGVGGPCSPTGVATFFAVLGAAHEAKPAKGDGPLARAWTTAKKFLIPNPIIQIPQLELAL